MTKSTDLGTVSILCIIFTAKWDTQQAHACNKHGILSCDGMYTEAQKITCIDLHYNQCVTDSESKNMTEYHLESLLPYKKKMDDILQLCLGMMFLH